MKDEPVQNAAIVKFIAGVIAILAAKYLPKAGMSDELSMTLAIGVYGIIATVVTRITRSKVTPMAKLERVSAGMLGEPEHRNLMAAMSVKKP